MAKKPKEEEAPKAPKPEPEFLLAPREEEEPITASGDGMRQAWRPTWKIHYTIIEDSD